jgi:hypothetical protein
MVETAPATKAPAALGADDERMGEAADCEERMEEATDGTAAPAESSPSSFYTVFKY